MMRISWLDENMNGQELGIHGVGGYCIYFANRGIS